MSEQGRHRGPTPPRTRGAKVVGAAAAGLTAALALAPVLAHADDTSAGASTGSTPSGAPSPTGRARPQVVETTTDASDPSTTAASDPSSTSPADPSSTSVITPDFGTNKIRIGVQIKDGAYAPGATTVGTTFTVVETGDGVDGGSLTTTCTTDDAVDPDAVPTSYCADDDYPYAGDPFYLYTAQPGDTVTVTQKTVNAQLAIDPQTITLPPCVYGEEDRAAVVAADDPPTCPDIFDPTIALFTDPGLPPKAVDDSATTTVNVPVDIDIRTNDTPVDPNADLAITSGPADGTVAVHAPSASPTSPAESTPPPVGTSTVSQAIQARAVAAAPAATVAGATTVTYTPAPGFVGVDHFRYQLSMANGTASALVTVTVTGPGATTTPTSTAIATSTAPVTSAPPTATTGTPTALLLETGAGLLAAGALAGFAGRRRRGRHAH